MLIKQLKNLWQGDSSLNDTFSKFDEMIQIAKEMFEKATSNLFDTANDKDDISRELVKLDGKLNALQQAVRRDIILHVTVHGSKNVPSCLILMSLVKDAERLGDYAKNIMEILERFTEFEKGSYFETLKKMQKDILRWFDDTRLAFDKIDTEDARRTSENAYKSEKECDRIAWEMITAKGKKDAVALALLFRFFKRTAAHLGNICSSVTMPLDKLDYYEKDQID